MEINDSHGATARFALEAVLEALWLRALAGVETTAFFEERGNRYRGSRFVSCSTDPRILDLVFGHHPPAPGEAGSQELQPLQVHQAWAAVGAAVRLHRQPRCGEAAWGILGVNPLPVLPNP